MIHEKEVENNNSIYIKNFLENQGFYMGSG